MAKQRVAAFLAVVAEHSHTQLYDAESGEMNLSFESRTGFATST
jgi:hypothetical protein